MKYIFTADLHIHEYKNDNKITDEGISLKLQEFLNCFEQMCEYALDNNIDNIIIGGDIVHHKNTIHTRPFVKFKNILDKYSNLNFIVYPGNHDLGFSNSKDSAVDLLSSDNVTVISEPTVNGNITYIPFSNDLSDELKKAKSNKVLCSHFPLSEGKTDTGISVNTKFSKKDLTKFDLILLGDYHTSQCIDNKIYYSGSLIPTTRAEITPKGFLVFDDETLEVEFIETTGYRKYNNIEINEETDLEEVKKIIQESKENDDFIIIKKNIEFIPNEIKEDVQEYVCIDKYEKDQIVRGICSDMSIEEQMKKYLSVKSIHEDDYDLYLSIGKKALKET